MALVARRPGRDTERAMSQENVELLRKAYRGVRPWRCGGGAGAVGPRCGLAPCYRSILGVDAVRGREAVRTSSPVTCSRIDRFQAEPLAFEDLGDAVLVTVRYVVGARAAALSSIRPSPRSTDCEMAAVQRASTRAKALEAAGLEVDPASIATRAASGWRLHEHGRQRQGLETGTAPGS